MILKGKDAKRFHEAMKKAETEKVSPEVMARIKKEALRLKSILVKSKL